MCLLLGNQLCDRDANYFMEALKNNTSLTSLDLSNNEFGETGGLYIAGALVSFYLTLKEDRQICGRHD